MVNILSFTRFFASQVVQDFFHQQHLWKTHKIDGSFRPLGFPTPTCWPWQNDLSGEESQKGLTRYNLSQTTKIFCKKKESAKLQQVHPPPKKKNKATRRTLLLICLTNFPYVWVSVFLISSAIAYLSHHLTWPTIYIGILYLSILLHAANYRNLSETPQKMYFQPIFFLLTSKPPKKKLLGAQPSPDLLVTFYMEKWSSKQLKKFAYDEISTAQINI